MKKTKDYILKKVLAPEFLLGFVSLLTVCIALFFFKDEENVVIGILEMLKMFIAALAGFYFGTKDPKEDIYEENYEQKSMHTYMNPCENCEKMQEITVGFEKIDLNEKEDGENGDN